MKFTLVIDEGREEETVVYAKRKSELTDSIERLVSRRAELTAYREDEIIMLDPSAVHCFVLEGAHLYALLDRGRARLKMRLYELEEILGDGFIKINQSAIANIAKIERFSVTLGTSLAVHFKNGYVDYVSRRRVKAVKERLGLR